MTRMALTTTEIPSTIGLWLRRAWCALRGHRSMRTRRAGAAWCIRCQRFIHRAA